MSESFLGEDMEQAYKGVRTKIVVATLNPALPPVVGVLLKQLHGQSDLDHERVNNMKELASALNDVPKSILVMTIMEPGEVPPLVHYLKSVEARIYRGTLRVIVINRMNHPKVMTLLKNCGVSEVVEFQITTKALNLKIRNQTLLLAQAFDRASREDRSNISSSVNVGMGGAGEKNKADSTPQSLWEPAHEHPSDYWVMTNKRNVRFVMGRWLIEMLGPAPSVGTWESTELTWRGEIGWMWKLRDANNPIFNRAEGCWIFFGRVPEFVWQKHLWSFVGKFPTMAYYANGQMTFYRFKCETAQNLQVRENSENAKDMIEEIKDTMDSSIRLSLEQKEGASFNVNLSPENQANTGPLIHRSKKPEKVADKKVRREKAARERAEGKTLSQMWATSSAGGPSAAWKNHMETPGIGMGPNACKIAPEVPAEQWGGSNLFQQSPTASALGLMDFSDLSLTPNSTVFESLKLEIEIRGKKGVSLARPIEVKLLDYLEGEVLLDVEVGHCSKQDFLELKSTLTLGSRKSEAELHGQVSFVDPEFPQPGETRCLVALQFPDEVKKRFESILNIFQERQLELNHFFRMARGA